MMIVTQPRTPDEYKIVKYANKVIEELISRSFVTINRRKKEIVCTLPDGAILYFDNPEHALSIKSHVFKRNTHQKRLVKLGNFYYASLVVTYDCSLYKKNHEGEHEFLASLELENLVILTPKHQKEDKELLETARSMLLFAPSANPKHCFNDTTSFIRFSLTENGDIEETKWTN
jgi:hypothetical protein